VTGYAKGLALAATRPSRKAVAPEGTVITATRLRPADAGDGDGAVTTMPPSALPTPLPRTLSSVNDPELRLSSEPGEPWAVDDDRDRHEVLLNAGYFGVMNPTSIPAHADAVADIGAAIIVHLRRHPGASDDELRDVALAAR
jgi:hypothetical protein